MVRSWKRAVWAASAPAGAGTGSGTCPPEGIVGIGRRDHELTVDMQLESVAVRVGPADHTQFDLTIDEPTAGTARQGRCRRHPEPLFGDLGAVIAEQEPVPTCAALELLMRALDTDRAIPSTLSDVVTRPLRVVLDRDQRASGDRRSLWPAGSSQT
jgi:hypothetical protein